MLKRPKARWAADSDGDSTITDLPRYYRTYSSGSYDSKRESCTKALRRRLFVLVPTPHLTRTKLWLILALISLALLKLWMVGRDSPTEDQIDLILEKEQVGLERFWCKDGSASFPLHYVNDDYCDCESDGSDEWLTSACSHVANPPMFACSNKNISLSKVGDLICDCDDCSDERTRTKTFTS
jgi:hypothetical protein